MSETTTIETGSRVLDLPDAARTYELDRAHVFHSWSAQGALNPMVVTRAEGSYLWDAGDNRLLDFTSQLVYTNLGHGHPKVVAAIAEQAATLCTVAPPYANAARSEAARLITSHTPDGLDKVFFTNGGADANEHAIRMARLTTGRNKVLARYRSYHGGTQLAVNVTGDWRRQPNDLGTEGVVHFFGPYTYRSAFGATTPEEEGQRALDHLRQVIELEGHHLAGPGAAGVHQGEDRLVAPVPHLRALARLDHGSQLLVGQRLHHGLVELGRLEPEQRIRALLPLVGEPR